MHLKRLTVSLIFLFLSLLTLPISTLTAHAAPATAGTVTTFGIGGLQPNAITRGPDGNLWFTAPSSLLIGRMTIS